MPLRDMDREQMWLLPPSLEDLLPLDHPARFVAEFVDALDKEGWAELGVEIGRGLAGSAGLPSQGAALRVAVWLHDRGALVPEVGGSLPGPDTLPVADRVAASGPQHPVAVLPAAPTEHEGAVQTQRADGGQDEAVRPGGAGGGRNLGSVHRSKGCEATMPAN